VVGREDINDIVNDALFCSCLIQYLVFWVPVKPDLLLGQPHTAGNNLWMEIILSPLRGHSLCETSLYNSTTTGGHILQILWFF